MSISEKLITITENVPKVYEKGKKDEYDKFWDEFQKNKNGERTSYENAFRNSWSFANFYPKYDIKPKGNANYMFYAWSDSFTSTPYSLKKRLEECGVVLDTSKTTSLAYAFAYSRPITEIPTLDLTGLTENPTGLFYNCYYGLKTVSFKVNENTPMGNWFGSNTTGVENLTIEGVIGKSGFNVKNCKNLTKESLLSILKALSLNITTTTTITFSTAHQTTIETDPDCKPYYDAAKAAGWSIVYA